MRKHLGWRVRIVAVLVVAGVAGLSIVAASSGSPRVHAATAVKCGMGTGKPATGTPIKLGSITTKQSGTDFSDIPNMTGAYFKCVNANGGIYGHPIDYFPLFEQTSATQDAAEARQLIQTDHVVGIAGSSSLIECNINSSYYAKEGFDVLEAGIAEQCYSSPNEAPVNMGARYSADGAVQTAILHGAKSIAFDQSDVPGTGYNLGGAELIAKEHGVKITPLTENPAALNGATAAEHEVEAAGTNHGAVVLVFTPPAALQILNAAQKLGLENKVIWACATPCNTDYLAKTLGPQWNHRLYVNAEMNDEDTDNGPDSTLYKSVIAQYGKDVSGGIGSFSQFGFTMGQLAVKALLSISPHVYTVKTVNAAFKALKGFTTDMLCKPWYFGTVPNNTDYTVWPQNGKMAIVPGSGCLPIDKVDPGIAAARAYEKAHGV